MVKFDVRQLRYLSKEEFRCLTALEMGMKNHEVVPSELIASIANLRHGGCYKILRDLVQYKLIRYNHKNGIRGYHLTYAGYDYLALRSLRNQDVVYSVGNKIGVGKESDIYIVQSEEQTECVLKLHRLGRICFRKVKEKRDYLKHRKSASWLYLSRLAAEREFSFLKALSDRGYPVPKPLGMNRHAIVMDLVHGYPLCQVKHITNTAKVYNRLMQLIVRLAQMGLIHGDFNEFNLMIDDREKVTVIDLPQMISTSHANAEYYFDRDVVCIQTWFKKRYNFDSDERPYLKDVIRDNSIDVEIKASGFAKGITEEFENLTLKKDNLEDGSYESDTSDSDLSEEEPEEEEQEEYKLENDPENYDNPDSESPDKQDSESIDKQDSESNDNPDSDNSEEASSEGESEENNVVSKDKEKQKKAAHLFTAYQKSNLSKDDIKKKVRDNEAKKRLKQKRIKKGEKFYINREKRQIASEIKGADSWF